MKHTREAIEAYLEQHRLLAEICLFHNVAEFHNTYQPGCYSIILLDVYMPEKNGMDIARYIRSCDDTCRIIFISSSDDFALDGYSVGASNYLLKPIDRTSLAQTLDQCFHSLKETNRYLNVVSNRSQLRIPFDSILWISTWQNAVFFHTDGGEIKSYMTFQTLLQQLNGDKRFLLCHRGCLINMNRISMVKKDYFLMDNQDQVQIRKQGANKIKMDYIQYQCNHMV